MHPVDWFVVIAFTAWIVYDGLKRTKHSDEIEGYFLAKRSIPWWAAGMSVMATQLSAITMIGTTGQAYADGMRFIQFYFGLPLAMIVLSLTLVPFFYNSGVYTAYEYLERRFDAKTRSATSLLFLLSRGLAVGAVVSAPAVVLSLVLGLEPDGDVAGHHAAGRRLHDVRRRPGGDLDRRQDDDADRVRPVCAHRGRLAWAAGGRRASATASPWPRPPAACAASTSRSTLSNQYTVWSGIIAAFFLFCSYFGTDQSQVQRYLTARSVDDARQSLLMSAYWKIPLQAMVLAVGVLDLRLLHLSARRRCSSARRPKPRCAAGRRHRRTARSSPSTTARSPRARRRHWI